MDGFCNCAMRTVELRRDAASCDKVPAPISSHSVGASHFNSELLKVVFESAEWLTALDSNGCACGRTFGVKRKTRPTFWRCAELVRNLRVALAGSD